MSVLKGKVAIVSGAAQGLGAAFVRALSEEGAHVLGVDIQAAMPTLAAQIARETGGDLVGLTADISKRIDVERLARAAVDRFGGIDILVNNAAIWEPSPIDETWEEAVNAFEKVTNTNIKGPLMLERVCIDSMLGRGGGDIVNVSASDVLPAREANMNAWDCDVYNASKWALNGLTSAWGRALEEHNIRVNGLCVGPTDTPMMQRRIRAGYGADAFSRLLKPEQVAAALIRLLTESAGRTAENVGVWPETPLELGPLKPVHRRLAG